MTKKQTQETIPLNAMERVLILAELETIQKGQEAQQRYERIVTAIANRAGYEGRVQIAQDVSALIPLDQPQEKPNATRQTGT